MADELVEYTSDDPIPHTLLLSSADAEKHGDRYRRKEAQPQNKARAASTK
jgi:hypothetical protein